MKAALNGGLNLSILDGWWDEWYDGENGWAIPTADGVADPDRRDDIEAGALYDLIENQVAPRFYDRSNAGIPTRWVEMVRHTLKTLGPKVLATRMVGEYVRELYAPAAASALRMSADGFAAARELSSWRARVLAAWPAVSVLYVDGHLDGEAQVGGSLSLRAELALGGLTPEDVRVEAVYGAVDAQDRMSQTRSVVLTPDGAGDGSHRFVGEIPLARTGPFGYTVRVLPRHELIATPSELGVVTVA
jgi:starch phosphorylase